MSREELLQMLQEKGMDDNAIKALLEETLSTLGKDFEDHAKKEGEAAAEDAEAAEKAEASKYLGVNL